MSAAADPLAGIGAPVGTPPPPTGSADPLASIGTPVGTASTPAPPQDNSLWGKVKNIASGLSEGTGDPNIDVPVGFVKSAAAGAGGLLHIVNDYVGNGSSPSDVLEYKQANPNASDADALQAVKGGYRGPTTKAANAHMTEAANWLSSHGQENGIWQNLGGVGELAGELLSPLGIEDAPTEGGRVLSSADKLAQQVKTAKFLEGNPKIAKLASIGARMLYGAAKTGAETGAQTYAHTGGDTGAATTAAELGAATGGVMAGGGGALQNFAGKTAPAVENIAGEDVQTLSSQRPGTGPRGDVKVAEVPKVGAAQQAAAPRVFRNVAQRATHDALTEANKGRVVASQISDPARLLAAPEDAQPYSFTVPGPPSAEGTTGDLLHPAAKFPRAAFKQPFYMTSSAATPTVKGIEGTTGADVATTGAEPEPRRDISTGADLTLQGPEAAQTHLSRLNDLLDNPPPDMAPEQLHAATQARDSLSDQMDMYHAYQRTLPNFKPIDAQAASQDVGTFGDARDQLQNAARPIYQKLDEISDGEFGRVNRERAAAGKRGDFTRQYELEGKIRDMIDSSPDITHDERAQASNLWSQSMVLDGLHSAVEHAANVNERYASEVAGGRVLSGVRLQNGLKRVIQQYGQDRVESVIGKDGMQNMTRMADLLNVPKAQEGFKGLSMSVMHNLMHGKVGGALGASLGYHVGGFEGALAGSYAGAKAERWLLQQAATSPRVGQLVDYAVRNHVTPKVAAGLISSATLQNSPPPQAEETEQTPAAPAKVLHMGAADNAAPGNVAAADAVNPSANIQQQADQAIDTLPPAVQQMARSTDGNVVEGKPETEPDGSVDEANVVQGPGENTITITDPASFQTHPAATIAHEALHRWQNNLPPSIQAAMPPDSEDPHARYDISEADRWRAQGQTLAQLPREKAAAIVQKYVEDPKKNANLKPWIDDMAKTPLSGTMPTPANRTDTAMHTIEDAVKGFVNPTINTTPRPPSLPSTDVAGMKALYDWSHKTPTKAKGKK